MWHQVRVSIECFHHVPMKTYFILQWTPDPCTIASLSHKCSHFYSSQLISTHKEGGNQWWCSCEPHLQTTRTSWGCNTLTFSLVAALCDSLLSKEASLAVTENLRLPLAALNSTSLLSLGEGLRPWGVLGTEGYSPWEEWRERGLKLRMSLVNLSLLLLLGFDCGGGGRKGKGGGGEEEKRGG